MAGASGPRFVWVPCWCGVRGLLGLLFEICIVDASIFVAGRSHQGFFEAGGVLTGYVCRLVS